MLRPGGLRPSPGKAVLLPVKLFFATTNEGKLRELAALARGLPVEIASYRDVGLEQVAEVGDSFAANALYKAEAAARRMGGWALADDSGLEVDALGGAPGVHSARWSGGGVTGNNARLLRELSGVPLDRRSAAFRCALALCHPATGNRLADGMIVEGACHGRIALAPRGEGGFGYDPLFEAVELGFRTFGEASLEEKARFSHRARAFQKLLPILELLVSGESAR